MKLLTRTPAIQEQIRVAMLEQMEKALALNGSIDKISLSCDIAALCPVLTNAIKPVIFYSPLAWLKMHHFTNNCNHEIALHGLVRKLKTPGQYYVYDMLPYPQTVAAATVKATDAYDAWLQDHEDAVFNNIRLQFHSHVSMPTGASGVDISYYESLISDIQDFYIFVIGNKQGDLNHMVYDKAQNILFDRADVFFDVAMEKTTLKNWLVTAETFIEKVTYPAVKTYNNSYVGSYQGDKDEINGYHKDIFPRTPNTKYEFGETDAKGIYHSYVDIYADANKKRTKDTAAEKHSTAAARAGKIHMSAKERKAWEKQYALEEAAEKAAELEIVRAAEDEEFLRRHSEDLSAVKTDMVIISKANDDCVVQEGYSD